jgi:hypothetical protein
MSVVLTQEVKRTDAARRILTVLRRISLVLMMMIVCHGQITPGEW